MPSPLHWPNFSNIFTSHGVSGSANQEDSSFYSASASLHLSACPENASVTFLCVLIAAYFSRGTEKGRYKFRGADTHIPLPSFKKAGCRGAYRTPLSPRAPYPMRAKLQSAKLRPKHLLAHSHRRAPAAATYCSTSLSASPSIHPMGDGRAACLRTPRARHKTAAGLGHSTQSSTAAGKQRKDPRSMVSTLLKSPACPLLALLAISLLIHQSCAGGFFKNNAIATCVDCSADDNCYYSTHVPHI